MDYARVPDEHGLADPPLLLSVWLPNPNLVRAPYIYARASRFPGRGEPKVRSLCVTWPARSEWTKRLPIRRARPFVSTTIKRANINSPKVTQLIVHRITRTLRSNHLSTSYCPYYINSPQSKSTSRIKCCAKQTRLSADRPPSASL